MSEHSITTLFLIQYDSYMPHHIINIGVACNIKLSIRKNYSNYVFASITQRLFFFLMCIVRGVWLFHKWISNSIMCTDSSLHSCCMAFFFLRCCRFKAQQLSIFIHSKWWMFKRRYKYNTNARACVCIGRNDKINSHGISTTTLILFLFP